MNRWWDDAAAAQSILEAVDGSDVAQGVGTALLGLHALSKAALEPLCGQTLVDPQQVHEALVEVDYSPVAKALAAAVEPVMGTAAEPYAAMLARDRHAAGMAGAQTMLTSLTGQGVPMPLALERVAEAAGLPASYSGRYLAAVKGEVVPALVRADAADRALMAYADAQGHLEQVVPAEVSKTAAFEESEHPRDEEGKFALKPTSPDRRAKRMARMARVSRVTRSQTQPLAIPQQASLTDLAAITAPRQERARAQQARAGRPRAQQARRSPTLQQLAEPLRQPGESPFTYSRDLSRPAKVNTPAQVNVMEFGVEDAQVLLVPDELMADIIAAGTVNALQLAQAMGQRDLTTQSADNASGVYSQMERDHLLPIGVTALVITGRIPTTDDEVALGRVAGVTIDPTAMFRVRDDLPLIGLTDAAVAADEAQAMLDSTHHVPALHLVLENEKDYPAPIGKAEAETWDVGGRPRLRLVTRDSDGQFATSPAGRSPREARMARMARIARVNRARQPVAAPAPVSEQGASLAELARATRPRAERARAGQQRTERTRSTPERTTRVLTPDSVDQEKDGTIKLLSQQAVTLSTEDVYQLLGDGLDALLTSKIPVRLQPHQEFQHLRIRPTSVPLAVAGWAESGSNPMADPIAASDSLQEAVDTASFFDEGNAPENAHAPHYTVRHNPERGTWEVMETTYDLGAAPIMLLGNPLAMLALERGDTPLVFRNVAETTFDLADSFDAERSVVGDRSVPLLAIEVSLLDDENR